MVKFYTFLFFVVFLGYNCRFYFIVKTSFDTEYYKPKWDGGTLINLKDNYITHMYIYMYISKYYIHF